MNLTQDSGPAEIATVVVDRLRLALGVGTAAIATWAVALALRHGEAAMYVVAVSFATAAVVSFWRLGKAPCPTCGALRTGTPLRISESLHCDDCGAYFRIRQGVTVATEGDAIEREPVFVAACPKQVRWPQGCCVCGGPASSTVPVELELREDAESGANLLTQAASLGTLKLVSERRYCVHVPTCAQHRRDVPVADLQWNDDEAQLYLAFRSRAYADAFIAANGPVFWDS